MNFQPAPGVFDWQGVNETPHPQRLLRLTSQNPGGTRTTRITDVFCFCAGHVICLIPSLYVGASSICRCSKATVNYSILCLQYT